MKQQGQITAPLAVKGMAKVMAKWLAIAALGASGYAYAGDDFGRDAGPEAGPGHGFMTKAEDACEGKQAGDAVTLTGRAGRSLSAVCTQRPAALVAVPTALLQRRAAAKAACSGLSEGAAAVISTNDGRNIAARCEQRDGELIAVPTERPHKRKNG